MIFLTTTTVVVVEEMGAAAKKVGYAPRTALWMNAHEV
jgi:hypothetical protein